MRKITIITIAILMGAGFYVMRSHAADNRTDCKNGTVVTTCHKEGGQTHCSTKAPVGQSGVTTCNKEGGQINCKTTTF
jgi:hypothetical protein